MADELLKNEEENTGADEKNGEEGADDKLSESEFNVGVPDTSVPVEFELIDVPPMKETEFLIIKIGTVEKKYEVPPGKILKNIRLEFLGFLVDAV